MFVKCDTYASPKPTNCIFRLNSSIPANDDRLQALFCMFPDDLWNGEDETRRGFQLLPALHRAYRQH